MCIRDSTTTTVRDFTLADVERFLSNWHSLVAIGQMGPGESAEAYADAPVSYTHLRAHETVLDLECRLLLEKKNNRISHTTHRPVRTQITDDVTQHTH